MVRCFILALITVFVLHCALAAGTDGELSEVLNELRQRIEVLEVRDAAKDARIAELEAELSELKPRAEDTDRANPFRNLRNISSKTNRMKRQTKNFRTERAVPEFEVAFYATHTDHDVHHLGSNQALLFQQVITNKGNAYSGNTGAFVAPVAGTYVFHATVMGIDITTNAHFRAHFNIDGKRYSMFYVTPFDQSSQMLVIDLTAGQTVSVRNDYTDNGFVGQHYSTFSGFLLYQSDPSGTIVG